MPWRPNDGGRKIRAMRWCAVLLAASLSGALFGFASATAGPITIRIGNAGVGAGGTHYVTGLAGLIAAEEFVEREFAGNPDIKVEWFYFKGAGPAINEALANDQIDFAHEGDLPSLTGRAAGLHTKIVMATNARDNLYLVASPRSDIQSIADIKGRKVAQFRGTSTHLTTERVLAQNNLKDRDIQFFNMDDGAALASVASGNVEAAFGKAIFLTLVEQGLAKVVFTTKDDPQTVTSSHLLVSEAFENAHPELVARVVKASVKAAAWASEEGHRDALFDIWAKSGIPLGVFRADYAGQLLAYRMSPLIDDLLIQNYRIKAQQVKTLGLVRREVDISGWFEPKYLDAALRELGLEHFWPRYGAGGKPIHETCSADRSEECNR
jgi:sulfonate transport system substrate-binding protein